MGYYPVALDLNGKSVLVVGGGNVAERKVESLLAYNALIHIISRDLTYKLQSLVESGKIHRIDESFTEKHLEGILMVVAATDNKELNHRVSECAVKKGLLINAVDQPADCNFFFPSVVKKGDLSIAISTSGKSPALAKRIREELEIQFGNEFFTE
jgi:precorrin-2 dehydrogenase/sirohydrochlorin ferrochelatase